MPGAMETPATAVIPDLGTNGDHGQEADKILTHEVREADWDEKTESKVQGLTGTRVLSHAAGPHPRGSLTYTSEEQVPHHQVQGD